MHSSSHTSVLGIGELLARRLKVPVNDVLHVCTDFEHLERSASNSKRLKLACYPLQCHFSGQRYPLEWLKSIARHGHLSLLDAASYCGTSNIDLGINSPDFLIFSFHKIFGFPTGVACLLIKNSIASIMGSGYMGGGTVSSISLHPYYAAQHESLSSRLEAGTLPFLEIVAVKHAFNYFSTRITFDFLRKFTLSLTRYCREQMLALQFDSDKSRLVAMYPPNPDHVNMGPIISFNLKTPNGEYVGYNQVSKLASSCSFSLRSGCHCNPGACQTYLGLDSQTVIDHRSLHGHTCGDEMDIIDGVPTGALRLSFGIYNTRGEIDEWIQFLKENFMMPGHGQLLDGCQQQVCGKAVVSELIVYPVKSCGGICLPIATIGKYGFLNDRNWKILDISGKTLTLKRCPQMARLRTSSEPPEVFKITIESDANAANFSASTVTLSNSSSAGIDEWLTSNLHVPARLVCNKDPEKSFVNMAHILLVSEASILCFNTYLSDRGLDLLSYRYFRPNIVITHPVPFFEDSLIGKIIDIGGVLFKAVSLCERCQMICVDPDSGRIFPGTLGALARFRGAGRKMTFGIYLELIKPQSGVETGTMIRLGQQLKIQSDN